MTKLQSAIKALVKKHGLVAFAHKIGVTSNSLSLFMTAGESHMYGKTLKKLQKAAGMPVTAKTAVERQQELYEAADEKKAKRKAKKKKKVAAKVTGKKRTAKAAPKKAHAKPVRTAAKKKAPAKKKPTAAARKPKKKKAVEANGATGPSKPAAPTSENAPPVAATEAAE